MAFQRNTAIRMSRARQLRTSISVRTQRRNQSRHNLTVPTELALKPALAASAKLANSQSPRCPFQLDANGTTGVTTSEKRVRPRQNVKSTTRRYRFSAIS